MRTQVPINVPAWWLIIMPVLMIILIVIIVLIVVHLVNTKRKTTNHKDEEKNKNYEDKTLTSWIKKKDLLYWLLIICLGTISLFTFRYKDATEVISHWSFAGTIVSIILAVVAIGFTLFQTLASNLSSEKIAVSADKIVSASSEIDSSELRKSGEIIKNAANEILNYHELVESRFNTINKYINELKDEQKKNFDNLFSGLIISESSNINDNQGKEVMVSIDSFVQKVIPKIGDINRVLTIYNFKTSVGKHSNALDYSFINEFTNTEGYKDKIKDQNILIGALTGSLMSIRVMLNNFGILQGFKLSDKKEEIIDSIVNSIKDQELKEFIMKFLDNEKS